MIGVKADAGVLDHERQQGRSAVVLAQGEADADRAFGGELDGVGQQVAQDLADTDAVADEGSAHVGRALDMEGQPLGLGTQSQGFERRGQDLVQIEGAQFQRQLARLDARHVEHVRDQPFQRDARGGDQAHHLCLIRRQRRA
ncbi:hypothetical protein D3C72_1795320 [compost metagenome]